MRITSLQLTLAMFCFGLLSSASAKEPAPPAAPLPNLRVASGDWPQWGGTHSKNMISMEKGLPLVFDPGKIKPGTTEVDFATTKNCVWVTKLGSSVGGYFPGTGPITIGDGKILVGANNESPRDQRHLGDRGILYCLDEKTGKFLWQLVVPKLGGGKAGDWELMGICSAAAIEGGRAYVITNRCEVLCIDMNGLTDGNQGLQIEPNYMAGSGKGPIKPNNTDADILWRYDMREELGVFTHNITSSSPLIVGERLYVTTSNGVDWTHVNIPASQAPSLICLDKKTGRLLGEENAGISQRLLHCSWSSPSFGVVKDVPQVFFGGGDGWCYGFGLDLKASEEEGEEDFNFMEELWRYDANPKKLRFGKNGNLNKPFGPGGPSEIIGTPVFYEDHVYLMIGQDAEHGEGPGMFSCIDPSMQGDLSGKAVWTFEGIGRGMSTPSIVDDLVYVAEYAGTLYCLDAKTGQEYWEIDFKSRITQASLVADGRVYIGNEDGELSILATGKKLERLGTVDFPAPLHAGIVAANGVLYISTGSHLYAFKK